MYARGHERGTRRQTRQASSWYDAIAEATLIELARTWSLDVGTGTAVPTDSIMQEDAAGEYVA